jgi:hypothetical protein
MKTQNTILSLTLLLGMSFSASANEHMNNVNLEIDSITYLEEEDSASLDFDTTAFLPEAFNPFAAPANFMHVSYIAEVGDVELGFDTNQYLPKGFNPHSFYFDIHSIEYIEEDFSDAYMDVQRFLQSRYFPTSGR